MNSGKADTFEHVNLSSAEVLNYQKYTLMKITIQ